MQDIEARLKTKGIRQDDFRAVCGVLLTKGLLSRSDGGESLRLVRYRRALRRRAFRLPDVRISGDPDEPSPTAALPPGAVPPSRSGADGTGRGP